MLPPGDLLWGVVTSIFKPTGSIHAFLHGDPAARLVIVADAKTQDAPWLHLETEYAPRVKYLSVSKQHHLNLSMLKTLPWSHFGRKNLGYLVAARHHASWVFDFDDDNFVVANHSLHAIMRGKVAAQLIDTSFHLYNPLMDFGPTSADGRTLFMWPRGFPLEFVHDERTARRLRPHGGKAGNGGGTDVNVEDVAIFQSLADHNPDVDAIYRMTRELPATFAAPRGAPVAVLPAGTYTPLNAQATLWRGNAIWGLLLPTTVSSRVSDIWRGYIAQRLMAEFVTPSGAPLRAAISPALVQQLRNPHSYLSDTRAEVELYTRSSELLGALASWRRDPTHGVQAAFVHLYETLVSRGLLAEADARLARQWVADLHALEYSWPPLGPIRPSAILPEAPVVDERCDDDAEGTAGILSDAAYGVPPAASSVSSHRSFRRLSQTLSSELSSGPLDGAASAAAKAKALAAAKALACGGPATVDATLRPSPPPPLAVYVETGVRLRHTARTPTHRPSHLRGRAPLRLTSCARSTRARSSSHSMCRAHTQRMGAAAVAAAMRPLEPT